MTASQIPFTITATPREDGAEHFAADIGQLVTSGVIAATEPPAFTGDHVARVSGSLPADASPEIAVAMERWMAQPGVATEGALTSGLSQFIEDEAVMKLGVYLDVSVQLRTPAGSA